MTRHGEGGSFSLGRNSYPRLGCLTHLADTGGDEGGLRGWGSLVSRYDTRLGYMRGPDSSWTVRTNGSYSTPPQHVRRKAKCPMANSSSLHRVYQVLL
eukprot:747453-Hanusia_phi.AAC.1